MPLNGGAPAAFAAGSSGCFAAPRVAAPAARVSLGPQNVPVAGWAGFSGLDQSQSPKLDHQTVGGAAGIHTAADQAANPEGAHATEQPGSPERPHPADEPADPGAAPQAPPAHADHADHGREHGHEHGPEHGHEYGLEHRLETRIEQLDKRMSGQFEQLAGVKEHIESLQTLFKIASPKAH